jgi:hypothetical protein
MRHIAVCAWITMTTVALGCTGACGERAASARCSAGATERYLSLNRERYEDALDQSRKWLEALPVDAVALRKQGHKGKKHFVEALDMYARLIEVAPPETKASLLASVKKLTAVTDDPAYHDMLTNDDTAFKQDATSYLRAALIMERIGLDTTGYREEIKKIEARLNGHMARRGVHQRMVFAWYYRHFGLTEPFPLAQAFQNGVIAKRRPLATIDRRTIYDLTHEIFAPYEYGDRLDADPFTTTEKLYLRDVLAALTEQRIKENDPDLVGELISCMRYLRFIDLKEYADGLAFLLLSQREDGAWGRYPKRERRYGSLVNQLWVLHTTAVVSDALATAFHEPWNKDVTPWCPPIERPTQQAAPAAESDAGFAIELDDENDAPEEP